MDQAKCSSNALDLRSQRGATSVGYSMQQNKTGLNSAWCKPIGCAAPTPEPYARCRTKSAGTQLNHKELQRLTRCLLASLKKQIALIDARLGCPNCTGPNASRKSLPRLRVWVGELPCCCWRKCPSLGTLNHAQTAALAGLAPFNRDSGTSSSLLTRP